jgi:hypothetical protein
MLTAPKNEEYDLDKILDALEQEGLITRTLVVGGRSGRLKQLVTLKSR